MARISLVVCDLCKENIEGAAVYGITLVRYNDTGDEYKEDKGEICPNCYRSLVDRLNKEVKPESWVHPRSQQAPSNPRQSLQCVGVVDGDQELALGRSDAGGVLDGSKKIINGETVIPSQGICQTGQVRWSSKTKKKKPDCKHNRKSLGPDEELICLECEQVLGKV